MDRGKPEIEVRAVSLTDAAVLHTLDYSFETDRIYTLKVRDWLQASTAGQPGTAAVLSFELSETSVDPPLYRDLSTFAIDLAGVEARLRDAEGGYIAFVDGQIAGVVLLSVERSNEVARIGDLIVGRQFRRYGVGSLLLSCASDWARNNACWAILLETQSTNYPAVQFYLRNGLEVWSIFQHFYPPGPIEHEVAIFMGKRLLPTT